MDTVQTPSPPMALAVAPETVPAKSSLKLPLILLGSAELIFPAIALYTLFPLFTLHRSPGSSLMTPILGSIYFGAIFLLALFQVMLGVLNGEARLGRVATKRHLIIGVIAAVFTVPALLYFVVMPTYQLPTGF